MELNGLHRVLAETNQSHLIKFWDELSEKQKSQLHNDLSSIEFRQVAENFRKSQAPGDLSVSTEPMSPIPDDCFGSSLKSNAKRLKALEEVGLKAISGGKVAVLLLAGGQGTRLGVNYPKGMYDVGLPSKKTLYQLQAERLLRLQQMVAQRCGDGHNVVVPWYIMTSEATKEQTERFFEERRYFGLDRSNVLVFEQSTLPCLDFAGKIILAEKHRIARAPDGNGGLYKALDRSGILSDMARRGVAYIHVYCVDNILVKLADPTFLGFCLERGTDCGVKVVEKKRPEEPVGLVCKIGERFQVVEYSEISATSRDQRNADGRLAFNAANIANHFFTLDFLERVVRENEHLLHYHVAKKKIPFVDEAGEKIVPQKPNGIKLEKFVFDVFAFSRNFAVWEVDRETEFAPLKNAEGALTDSPTQARESLMRLHRSYLKASGAVFDYEDDTGVCEISPLLSYAGEGLESLVCRRNFRFPILLDVSPGGDGDASRHLNGTTLR